MRKGLLGFLRRTLIDLQEKYISIIIKKAWTEQVKDIKTEGKLKVASNNSCYGFQTFILHVFWDAASRYIPFPTPQQPLSPLHLTPTAQHVLSEDFQTMPRGYHSLIFLKIPLSSPLLKNVWKADTKLEKRNKGKKKRSSAHLGVRVVSLVLNRACGGEAADRSSVRAQHWSLGQHPCKLSN